MLHYKYFNK